MTGTLAIIGWALGATLVGAEFTSRSMTSLLTWEPRRWRVFIAKSIAAVATMSLFALVTLVLVALAMWPALAFHGAPLQPDDPTLASLGGDIARGVALTALASGIGFAIATMGRNTAIALGVGFGYIVILENILGSSLERWRQWLILGNVIVLVSGNDEGGGEIPGRTVVGAALFLTVLTVAMLAVAGGTFRTARPRLRLTARREAVRARRAHRAGAPAGGGRSGRTRRAPRGPRPRGLSSAPAAC